MGLTSYVTQIDRDVGKLACQVHVTWYASCTATCLGYPIAISTNRDSCCNLATARRHIQKHG